MSTPPSNDQSSLSEWAIESLRCPDHGVPVAVTGDHEAVGVGCDCRRPPVAGRICLMPSDGNLWRDSGAVAAHWDEDTGTILRRIVNRLRNSASTNLAAELNFRQLQKLLEMGPRPKARVLVVGGGVLGAGISPLLASVGIEVVETDIYPGSRAQLVCDAHTLPFADETFDAVVAQAVLEHVIDPPQVVREIYRVLCPSGLVYSEIPFMQQVHAGPFDFTRYTELGHRRLFRMFDEIDRGPTGGPGSSLMWSMRYFARSLPSRSGLMVSALDLMATALTSWITLLDRWLIKHPGAHDGASGTYFLGRRRTQPVGDLEIVSSYTGTFPAPTASTRE
jgi:SAM-dependent methyltransferase